MNRRNLLKTFLAAPAIIRSGVLMPVVPLAFDDRALLHWKLKARSWWIDSEGRAEFSGVKFDNLAGLDAHMDRMLGPVGALEQRSIASAQDFLNRMYADRFMRALRGAT